MPDKTTADQLVAQVRANTAWPYIPTRYPYTYAADFIRQNPELVPAEVRNSLTPENPHLLSRWEASQLRKMWATVEERDDAEMAQMLADAYMQVHGIVRP